jgi:hypothetical protein
VWPSDTRLNVRVQLKSGGHSGKWGGLYVSYKKKYKNQLDDIIRGMFPNGEPAARVSRTTGKWILIQSWVARDINIRTLTMDVQAPLNI